MVRITDRPDMTLDVYCGRKTKMQQQSIAIHPKDADRNANSVGPDQTAPNGAV